MHILIVCVGKLRERYWRDAADEYEKRLSRFVRLDTFECPNKPEPNRMSDADIQKILLAEETSLLSQIKPKDYVIALCIEGKQMDSLQLAEKLQALEMSAASRTVFVIGGSHGLSPGILKRADHKLSFSKMTFPHQLARIMLLEQLYRAKKINAGEAYHK